LSRLHEETSPELSGFPSSPQQDGPQNLEDLEWDLWYAPLIDNLVRFAVTMRENGGPSVKSSVEEIQFQGIPDGMANRWVFPTIYVYDSLELEVEIDLHEVHPIPVQQILLLWSGDELPQGYSLFWADDTHKYRRALVPNIGEGLLNFNEDGKAAIPVPVELNPRGTWVRYVKLVFPQGSLMGVRALEEMRFVFKWGRSQIPLEKS
jgi:hypothetical protein